jgi:hypothetical protein
VLLPAQNRKEYASHINLINPLATDIYDSAKELPQEVKDGLEIIHVRYVQNLVFLGL